MTESATAALNEQPPQSMLDIGEHLFKTLRGSNNLIFPNSRGNVEFCADNLLLDELLARNYSSHTLDVVGGHEAIKTLVQHPHSD